MLGNPTTLTDAITRSKLVENGFKVMLTNLNPSINNQPAISTPSPSASITLATPIASASKLTAKDTIDALTKQMEQLTINYANLSSNLRNR